MIDDELAGYRFGGGGAKVFLDQGKSQIEASAHPGGGPNLTVDDEYAVLFYDD